MREKREKEETLVTATLALVTLLVLAGGFWWLLRGGGTGSENLSFQPSRNAKVSSGFAESKAPPLQADTQLTIGTLSTLSSYESLADYLINYLQNRLGDRYQVLIDGGSDISYQDAKAKLASREWDIAFTYSPMLSVIARDNGYTYAGVRMFPDSEPYYESALFVRQDSPINSLQDLGPSVTLALGDFNSASSFYMPIYGLYGKRLRVIIGNRGKRIREMVASGEADVGAVAYSTIKDKAEFKIIHISRKIPGSGVYLSPNLTDVQREAIGSALLSAPAEIQKEANFGQGSEVDYTEFIKISRRVEQLLGCTDFNQPVVNLFCGLDSSSTSLPPTSSETASIQGKINGFSFVDQETVVFYLVSTDGKRYRLTIPRLLLNQSSLPPPPGWQNRTVVLRNSQPDDQLKITVSKIEQVVIVD